MLPFIVIGLIIGLLFIRDDLLLTRIKYLEKRLKLIENDSDDDDTPTFI